MWNKSGRNGTGVGTINLTEEQEDAEQEEVG